MKKYKKDNIVVGSVTGIEDYGIFVNLDQDYSGLIHISEVSKNFVRDVNDYVNMGETINVKILDVDENKHHMKLSIKDIDYRINKKNKNKIEETEKGFATISKMLPRWVKSKLEEINSKNR